VDINGEEPVLHVGVKAGTHTHTQSNDSTFFSTTAWRIPVQFTGKLWHGLGVEKDTGMEISRLTCCLILAVSFLSSAKVGDILVAHGKALKVGGRLAFTEVQLLNKVCTLPRTCMCIFSSSRVCPTLLTVCGS
jgi:hypothetical protein